jgi:hypothetical protein
MQLRPLLQPRTATEKEQCAEKFGESKVFKPHLTEYQVRREKDFFHAKKRSRLRRFGKECAANVSP